jgi:serine/threonine-protein kinase
MIAPRPRDGIVSRIRLEAGSEPLPGLELVQLRGRGGFAEVWEAMWGGNPIAVKFMTSRNALSSSKEIRIIQTLQKLTHPHLIHIDRVWAVPGYIVVAMELADGSLFEFMDAYQQEYQVPIHPNLLLSYMKQVAEALDFLNKHQHPYEGKKIGFQHGDIKPSNILFVGDQMKLADFGLCLAMTSSNVQFDRCGTLDFASPEVHRGYMTNTSDQYSLAITYYHLRTGGGFPFPPPPVGFSRKYSYQRPAPDLSLVESAERRILERALEIEPLNRWPNCLAMIEALSDHLLPKPIRGSRFEEVSTV